MSEAIVSGPGDGERLERSDRTLVVKVDLPELSATEITFEPSFRVDEHTHDDHVDSFYVLEGEVEFEFELDPETDGAGPHFHARHVDSFYVLEGELEVLIGEEPVRVKAGELVAAPPGVVHGFANRSDSRTRFVNMHAPGFGFADYMRRMDAGEDFDPLRYDVHEVD